MSVLCMPVFNSDKRIIGVTQLINKLNGSPFNDNDANIMEVSAKSVLIILVSLWYTKSNRYRNYKDST